MKMPILGKIKNFKFTFHKMNYTIRKIAKNRYESSKRVVRFKNEENMLIYAKCHYFANFELL